VDRDSLFRALAFVIGVVLVVELAWGTYKAVTIANTDFSSVETVETLDTDNVLANKIDSLEANWESRRAYHFKIDQDPLYLGRVILGFSYSAQGYSELDEGSMPRLSATVDVINDRPMAIIKYLGKSHVVKIGDTFGDGYVVGDIKRQEVMLRRNGKTITLQNQPINGPTEDTQQGNNLSQEW
jgi:type II secretory pathway component PulC